MTKKDIIYEACESVHNGREEFSCGAMIYTLNYDNKLFFKYMAWLPHQKPLLIFGNDFDEYTEEEKRTTRILTLLTFLQQECR